MLHAEIWVVNLRTGARQNLSRNPAGDSHASVSPDLKTVAFVSDRSGAEAVWVEPTASKAVRRFAGPFGDDATIDELRWSPRGAEIGFVVSPRRQVRIVPRNGRGGRWLGRLAGSFGWSPDATRIAVGAAVESANPFVTVFDRRGRPLARLPGYLGGWSSRGALVVVGPEQTVVTDADGRRTATLTKAPQARWSPDGRLLALSSATELRLVTADGRLRLRRPRLSLDDAGWAPDSRSVLVRDRSYRLARLSVGGVLTALTVGRRTAFWSRGGRLLAFDYAPNGFLVYEQGRTRRIDFPLPRGGCGGGFSLEGWLDAERALVSVGRGGQNPADLWVVDAGGGVAGRFLGGSGWDGGPVWSPDGSRLAYERRDVHTHAGSCDAGYQSHVAVARADGTASRLLPPEESISGGPRWSPDGTRIVAERESFSDEAEFGIVVANADLDAQTRLTTGFGSSPSWSADGTSIVFQHGTSQIRRVPAAGGATVAIGTGALPEASPVAPLVAFVRERAVWVMGLDGSSARRLAQLRPRELGYTPLRWSPDGSRLAVADAAGILVVAVAESRQRRIPRTGARAVAWSPDGRQLAFAAPVGRHSRDVRSELFVVSASGGSPRRLTHDLASVGGISWRP